jgi:hypothetical protein
MPVDEIPVERGREDMGRERKKGEGREWCPLVSI